MGSHKKKSKRRSRSRSKGSDDLKLRQKSRLPRRRSSSSSNEEYSHRKVHTSGSSRSTRHRSHSHSPYNRRKRSRSRSYSEHSRRRNRSRSKSKRSKSRSRSLHRERRHSRSRSPIRDRRRSRSSSRSRHSSRKCSPNEREKVKGKEEKTSSDLAPSELLKQKMQKALGNVAGTTVSKEPGVFKREVDEENPDIKKELKRIEKDSFRQTAFKSSRWDLNPPKPSTLSSSRPMTADQIHDSAIFGSATTNGSTHPGPKHPNVAALLYRPDWKLTCESLRASSQEKMDRWIEKLQMWRKKRLEKSDLSNHT